MNTKFNPADFKVPNNPIINCLFEYETGKLGVLFADGVIEKTMYKVGDCSPFTVKDLKWYESYVNGKISLDYPFWKILGYDSEYDFRADVRSESSTGWVERQLLSEMPERWHEKIRRYFN